MSLRRGFKAEANRKSVDLRQRLGLRPTDAIDLRRLAVMLNASIVPLSSFRREHQMAVDQLILKDPAAFSACCLPFDDGRRVIIHNDHHSAGRQNSNIAHELAHILLNHPATLPLDHSGCRIVDRDIEEEANWLAGVLLVPNEAAVFIVRSGLSTEEACARYGVSEDLLRMRINLSGARRRVRRVFH